MQITVVIHILIYAWLDYADASQTWLLNNRLGLIPSPIFISCFKQILLTLLQTWEGFAWVEILGFFTFLCKMFTGTIIRTDSAYFIWILNVFLEEGIGKETLVLKSVGNSLRVSTFVYFIT